MSRTDPLIDAVLQDGSLGVPGGNVDPIEAKVYSVTKYYIRVQVDTPIDGLTTGEWRLDIGLNAWAHRVQLNAITALNYDPVKQDMADALTRAKTPVPVKPHSIADQAWAEHTSQKRPEQTILAGTALRDKLLRAFQEDYMPYQPTDVVDGEGKATQAEVLNDGLVAPPKQLHADDVDAVPSPTRHQPMSGSFIRNELIRSWTTRYRAEGEVIKAEGDPEIPLNPSQMRAIAMMLSERLSLVQGVSSGGFTVGDLADHSRPEPFVRVTPSCNDELTCRARLV
jgi:hypothetical protein